MAEELELKIMSYNIWNYNDPWPERRKMIVENILEVDPDIIGLQEIRDDRKYNSLGHHQAKQIAERTGLEYQFQPAMVYSKSPKSVEGVCIMSRHPINSTAYVKLTRKAEDEKDFHQRIVLNGTIDLPIGNIDFFVTHFSLSSEMRVKNALELLQFVNSFNSSLPKFVVGDFNSVPNDRPIKILTGRENIKDQSVIGNLIDIWDEAPLENRKPSSGEPHSHGDKRIDFIFMTPSPWVQIAVKEASFLNPCDPAGLNASDHAAVTTTVSISVEG